MFCFSNYPFIHCFLSCSIFRLFSDSDLKDFFNINAFKKATRSGEITVDGGGSSSGGGGGGGGRGRGGDAKSGKRKTKKKGIGKGKSMVTNNDDGSSSSDDSDDDDSADSGSGQQGQHHLPGAEAHTHLGAEANGRRRDLPTDDPVFVSLVRKHSSWLVEHYACDTLLGMYVLFFFFLFFFVDLLLCLSSCY